MRRDEEACELRSDILRKNALIADLTLMNERLSVGKDKELITSDLEGQRSSLPTSDGALELELAQTKVCYVIIITSQLLRHNYYVTINYVTLFLLILGEACGNSMSIPGFGTSSSRISTKIKRITKYLDQ